MRAPLSCPVSESAGAFEFLADELCEWAEVLPDVVSMVAGDGADLFVGADPGDVERFAESMRGLRRSAALLAGLAAEAVVTAEASARRAA